MTRAVPGVPTDRRFNLLVGITIACLGITAYINTYDGEFVWDDVSSVLLHEHVRDPGSIFALFTEDQHAFAGGQGNFYRPLVSVSFMGDYVLSSIGVDRGDVHSVPHDLGTFFFHLSNTFWHVAAALLLFVFMQRTGAPRAVRAFVPIAYVLHPLHTEAVAYISGRADSMSAAFMFAALVCVTWQGSTRRRVMAIFLMLVFFSCGLLSKESSLIFPALLGLALFILPRPETDEASPRMLDRWLPFAAALGIVGIYVGLRTTVLNFGSDSTPPDSTFVERIIESLQALGLYAQLTVAPVGLHMERTLVNAPAYAAPLGTAVLIGVIVLFAVCLWTNKKRPAVGLGWFVATWLPISGIFPLNAPMAEHWMYVPIAGLLWAMAELVNDFLGKRAEGGMRRPLMGAIAALAILWVGMLLVLTVQRNADWHSNQSIYTATLRENPSSTRVHFNLAVTYQDMLNNPSGALRHFESVTRAYEDRKRENPALREQFWNEEMESYLSLGDIHFAQGHIAEAYNNYRILVTVLQDEEGEANRSLLAGASYGLGRCQLRAGNPEAAMPHLERAVQILPDLRPRIEALLSEEALLG